jgi:hypothetical protein
MIAHVVLFRTRADLPSSAQSELASAFEAAIQAIPSIRRARIGTRVMHGRPYEAMMRSHYPYAAVLEFDDVAGLKAYLEHPAHERLGSRFFEAFEDALMYDFDMQEGASGLAAALASPR